MSSSETAAQPSSSSSATSDADWRTSATERRRLELVIGEPFQKLPVADPDPVAHPSHYADGWSNGAEVIDITEHLNFNRGNAVKYVTRAGRKNPETEVEDLYKAAWYIQREIDRLVRA